MRDTMIMRNSYDRLAYADRPVGETYRGPTDYVQPHLAGGAVTDKIGNGRWDSKEVTGGYTKRNKLCHKCWTLRSVKGQCLCN